MQKILRSLFVVFVWIGIGQAHAEEVASSDLNLILGGELRAYRYVEPGLISHSGPMLGVWGHWGYQTTWYKGLLDGNIFLGSLDYNGAVCSLTTGKCSDYSAKTFDVISKFTHRFSFEVSPEVDLFVGAGLRSLYDRGDGSVFYTRLGNYYFLPLGSRIKFLTDGNPQGAHYFVDLEYDVFLKGTMTSRISEVNSSMSDIEHQQNTGYGLQISAGYQQSWVEQSHPMQIQVFYEKWRVEASDTVSQYSSVSRVTYYYTEPKNFTESYGVKVGWGF